MASPDSQPRDTPEVVCETQVVETVPESLKKVSEDAEQRPARWYLTESTVICLL